MANTHRQTSSYRRVGTRLVEEREGRHRYVYVARRTEETRKGARRLEERAWACGERQASESGARGWSHTEGCTMGRAWPSVWSILDSSVTCVTVHSLGSRDV